MMNATIPADLLDLKARLEQWRATRKYIRQPIPEDLRLAVRAVSERHPPSLVRRTLKINPARLKERAAKKTTKAAPPATPPATFFKLSPESFFPAGANANPCQLLIERPDGARLTFTLPALDLASARLLCADFLGGWR
jgi:hypothetical protein